MQAQRHAAECLKILEENFQASYEAALIYDETL
jgi:hypothetical protein